MAKSYIHITQTQIILYNTNKIKSIDKKAFISVSTAMIVYGEGFEEVKTGLKKKKTNKAEEEAVCQEVES